MSGTVNDPIPSGELDMKAVDNALGGLVASGGASVEDICAGLNISQPDIASIANGTFKPTARQEQWCIEVLVVGEKPAWCVTDEPSTPAEPEVATAPLIGTEAQANAAPAEPAAAALGFIAKYTSAISAETICLVAIVPDGKTETRTFDASDVTGMRPWIDARQGHKNLYFTVNRVKGRPSSKPSKGDMAEAVTVWADIDPRDGEISERRRALRQPACRPG